MATIVTLASFYSYMYFILYMVILYSFLLVFQLFLYFKIAYMVVPFINNFIYEKVYVGIIFGHIRIQFIFKYLCGVVAFRYAVF